MRRLLLLVPTTSYRVGDFLAAARRLQVDVAVGSNRRQVLERFAEGATVTLDFRNPERGVAQIQRYHQDHPLAAIVPTDEETTVLAARAGAALGLPHNPPEAVAAAGNKELFRRQLAAAGLPGPGFRLLDRATDLAEAAARQHYPCVVKPLGLSASRGVLRADDPPSFCAAVARIGRILDDPETLAPTETRDHILVEDFLPGREVALEGLLERGLLRPLAIFDKPDPLDGPTFEETLYITPSRHPAATQDAIIAAIRDAVAALGLRDGPIHGELRLSPAGPVVIELAARSIGGLCARTLKFGLGLSLEELILRHALGLPIETFERETAAAGVMMIPIPKRGRLKAVQGLLEAEAVAAIEAVSITLTKGQAVVPLPEGNRYLGFIFARAERPEAVEAALRAAHACLSFEIVEDEVGATG